MAAKTESYAAFERLGDLLSALALFTEKGNPTFPPQVLKTRAWQWALQLKEFGKSEHLMHFAKQHGWEVTILDAQPEGEWCTLASLRVGEWIYRDPFAAPRQSKHDGSGNWWDDDSIPKHDPEAAGMQYLLGARNKARAWEMLKVLTEMLMPGIRALPLILESVKDQCPFQFFWLVTMERPILTVLHSADRVWWGPVGRGRVQIFEEWPYHLNLPEICLHKTDWGAQTGFVLLSRSEPRVLTVRRPDSHPPTVELIQVVKDILVEESQILQVQTPPPERPPMKFDVELKLVPGDTRRVLRDRLNDLRQEIAAKQKIVEWMVERAAWHQGAALPPEPLYLYYDEGKGIPDELQSLLVEWTEQKEELQSLRYLKIAAGSLPAGLFPEGTDVHVLTTARALGEDSPPDLGLRLSEYRPRYAEHASFDLVPEWDRFGLYLFVPREHHAELYPDFRPGALAAKKLADALLPGPMDEWLALLLPIEVPGESGRRVRALQLRRSDFKPLIESFEWDCRLDFKKDYAEATIQTSSGVLNETLSAVEDAVKVGVQQQMDNRLRQQETILLEDLEREGKAASQITEVRNRLSGIVADHQKFAEEMIEMMRRNESVRAREPDFDTIRSQVRWSAHKVTEIEQMLARLRDHQREVEQLARSLEQTRQQLANLRQTKG